MDFRAIRCLNVGFRVEAALWSGRIAEALILTCSFFDAALLDFIQSDPRLNVERIIELENIIHLVKPLPPDHILVQSFTNDNNIEFQPCLKGSPNPLIYKYRTGSFWTDRSLKFLNIKALKEYHKILKPSSKSANSPLNLRHTIIHAKLQSKFMRKVVQVFQKKNLWSENPQKHGEYFLCQPLVQNVFMELGISNPQQIFSGFLDDLLKELMGYVIA